MRDTAVRGEGGVCVVVLFGWRTRRREASYVVMDVVVYLCM